MPPVADAVAENGAPTVAVFFEIPVIASEGSATVTVYDRLAVAPLESVTVAVTVKLPGAAVAGMVPLIAPPDEMPTPSGRPPAEKVYGGAPPLALTLAE